MIALSSVMREGGYSICVCQFMHIMQHMHTTCNLHSVVGRRTKGARAEAAHVICVCCSVTLSLAVDVVETGESRHPRCYQPQPHVFVLSCLIIVDPSSPHAPHASDAIPPQAT